MNINKARAEDSPIIAALADEIWREYYTPLIGKEQVDYMLMKFQSKEAIENDITSGNLSYSLISKENKTYGYIGYRDEENSRFFLSKLYVKKNFRGNGTVKAALNHLKGLGAKNIYLTVNRENYPSIHSYKKSGFSIIKEVDADIGSGYIMNDYIMEISI